MSQWYLSRRLRTKLRLAFAVTLGSVLFIITLAFIALQVFWTLHSLGEQIRAIAEVIAANVAGAVEFEDQETAKEILKSAFRKPETIYAAVYDRNGHLFASVLSDQPHRGHGNPRPPEVLETLETVKGVNDIEVIAPVVQQGKTVGYVCVKSTMQEAWNQAATHILVAVSIIVLAGIFSAYVIEAFHRVLIKSLESLQVAMERITQTGDYSMRVEVLSRDEIGKLGEQFNTMLERVEHAQKALQEANETLEARIRERTKELEKACEAAESANRAKSLFLANMSHEIRTPMTAILGYLDFLSERNTTPAERAEYIAIIRRNGEHLLALINDILDLSRIEAGQVLLQLTACKPLQVVHDVISLMQVRAKAKGLDLSVRLETLVPETITSDPVRLKQILVNLVGNAIKFTDKGQVILSVSLREDSEKPKLCFAVHDTGPGIPLTEQQRIFEAFVQGENSYSRRHGGTGLGLTISQKLARLLGGDITVESSPGKGSTFTVWVDTGPLDGVPMVKEFRPVTGDDCPAQSQPERRLHGRVLLAEDGVDNQRLISFILSKAGFDVSIANNGEEAIRLFQEAREEGCLYDCILMDMQMPVMDGYTAVRKLRSLGCTTPIVALTAHAMVGDREACLEAGCDDYLSKPIDRASLINTVARYAARTAVEAVSS